jgi:hypothetical protein
MIHQYDDFLARLAHGPIVIADALACEDGEARCIGNSFEITRTVMRLEYAGYQCRNRRKPSPYIREVYSCGHSHEITLGSFNWQKPRKTTICCECAEVLPLSTARRWLRERERLHGGMLS